LRRRLAPQEEPKLGAAPLNAADDEDYSPEMPRRLMGLSPELKGPSRNCSAIRAGPRKRPARSCMNLSEYQHRLGRATDNASRPRSGGAGSHRIPRAGCWLLRDRSTTPTWRCCGDEHAVERALKLRKRRKRATSKPCYMSDIMTCVCCTRNSHCAGVSANVMTRSPSMPIPRGLKMNKQLLAVAVGRLYTSHAPTPPTGPDVRMSAHRPDGGATGRRRRMP